MLHAIWFPFAWDECQESTSLHNDQGTMSIEKEIVSQNFKITRLIVWKQPAEAKQETKQVCVRYKSTITLYMIMIIYRYY